MGVVFSKNLITVYQDAHDISVEKLADKVNDIADEALYVADEEMKKVIETTPSSIVNGKDNRIDTGLMHDSVSHTYMNPSGNNKWTGYAGWTKKLKDYFLTQEYGGETPKSWGSRGGIKISPMHMLTKGKVEMVEYLRERLGGTID